MHSAGGRMGLSMYTTTDCMLGEVKKGPALAEIAQVGLRAQAHCQCDGPGTSGTRLPGACPSPRASVGSGLGCLFFSNKLPALWQQKL